VLARRDVFESLLAVTIKPQGIGKRFEPAAISIDWVV
jgi:hypothetical protein